jgi:trans-aconitate 2-methyltransferase
MWSAEQYLKFDQERSRPFTDLLAHVRRERAGAIADLGCGTGHLTRTLAERWPESVVTGVDSSPEMLQKAVPLALAGRLTFVQADLASWPAPGPLDLIVSNAALHWVGGHDALLARLAGMLAPGGTLAVQMPNRFHTAAQGAIEETTADPRWASRLGGVGLSRESVRPLVWYVRRLHELGFAVDAWETTYVHVLTGEHPVVQWLEGTGVRPLLERLGPDEWGAFRDALATRLAAAYPPEGVVTLFPFPRLFFVATAGGGQRTITAATSPR